MENFRHLWRVLLLLVGVSLFASGNLRAVTIDWDRNSETDIAGYRIYWGPASRAYTSMLDVSNNISTHLSTPSNRTFYAVTAYTVDGLESDYSEEVTYAPSNQVPIAVSDSFSTPKNQSLNVAAGSGVLANDTDADGDTLTAILIANPTHGTLNLLNNGGFTYAPATGYTGSDVFTYRVTDGKSTSSVASVTLTISPLANQPPVAVNDAYSGWRNQTLHIDAANGVLNNDFDPDGDSITAFLVSPPPSGLLTLQFDGTFTFKPASNFTGTVQFTYRATDGNIASPVTTVSLVINSPPNQTPVANNDNFSLLKNQTLTVNPPGVLGNDSDGDSDPLSCILVSNPSSGFLTLQPSGAFTYLPASNFTGTVQFSYRATDGKSTSSVATVSLTVNAPPNQTPIAVGDSFSLLKNQSLIVNAPGILGNDSDADGDLLSCILSVAPSSGSLNLQPNGSFTYQPFSNFTGNVQFSYRVTDGKSTSAVATVSLTVNAPPNQTPIAIGDSYSLLKNQALTVNAPGVLANDSDGDGDSLSSILLVGPSSGSLTLQPNGSFTYFPASNYTGTVQFSYRTSDGKSTSSVATVTLTVNAPPNQTPIANSDSFSLLKNQTLTLNAPGVLGNDSDGDGDSLSCILSVAPSIGSLNLQPNGSFTYQPATNFTGSVQFSYRVTDGKSTSAVAAVSLTISPPPNQVPNAFADSFITLQNQLLTRDATEGVLANDSDPDNDSLIALLVSVPANGALQLSTNGSFTFQPANNFTGTTQFSYRASDGRSTSAVATVTINVVAPPPPDNHPPTAVADAYSTEQNKLLTIGPAAGVLGNDSDVDNDFLRALLVSGPASGTLILRADGSFTYRPSSNFTGTIQFSYSAADAISTSAVAVVQITVIPPPLPTNASPIAISDSYSAVENGRLTISAEAGVLTNDIDADGDSLSATLVSGPASGTLFLEPNGAFSYEPPSNFVGSVQFAYCVTDGKSNSEPVTVTISVSELTCELCVAGLETALTSREQYLATIRSIKTASANQTCLDLTLTIFKTLAKTADVSGDPILVAALTEARERIAFVIERELQARQLQAKDLPESRWLLTATNKLESARKLLENMNDSSPLFSAAKTFSSANALLKTADRSLTTAETAPATLAEKTFAWRPSRTEKWVVSFTADEFLIQSEEGEVVTRGPYAYTRTSWNTGHLWFVPTTSLPKAAALETAQASLKFSRLTCRADGSLKGIWRRSN